MNNKGGDSRLEHHKAHFNKAVELGRTAKSWRTNETGFVAAIKNWVADYFENRSLDQLGKSLHPLQDIDAHTTQSTRHG